jgi:hypothetical protein
MVSTSQKALEQEKRIAEKLKIQLAERNIETISPVSFLFENITNSLDRKVIFGRLTSCLFAMINPPISTIFSKPGCIKGFNT